MNNLITLFFSILLFVCQLANAEAFEGILTMTVSAAEEGTGQQMQFYVKGDKLSLDMDGSKIIMDAATDDLFIVSATTVLQLKMDLVNQLGGVGALTGRPTYGLQSNAEGNNIKVTSEKAKIDGYNCTKYIAEDDNYKSEVWVAENFPFDFSGFLSALSMGQKFSNTTKPFPIKGSSTNKKDGKTNHYKFKVEKSAVPDDAFALPQGAIVMDLSMMLKNMLQTSSPEEISKQLQMMMPK